MNPQSFARRALSGAPYGKLSAVAFCALTSIALPYSAFADDTPACVLDRDLNLFTDEIAAVLNSDLSDKRFTMPREREGLRAFDIVGAVSISDGFTKDQWVKSGSGTLLSACYAVTSYHVVFPDFDAPGFQFNPQRRVAFSFGASSDEDRPFKHSIEGEIVDLGFFNPARPAYVVDQLLIRLKHRAPASAVPATISTIDDKDIANAPVFACGFPGNVDIERDKPQPLFCDQCAVKGYHYLRGYETNCTVLPGTSGGAIFKLERDARCEQGRKLTLIGAPNQSPGQFVFSKRHPRLRSFATDFNKTSHAIKKIIAQDDCPAASEAK